MRDSLPEEARVSRRIATMVLDEFALHGYQLVIPAAFELAEVLERGLGALDPKDVLRFVEPESGEIAALRPDMTPQIARMAATRLLDHPPPLRLCYEGTVLRRRQERARRHRQISQAGVELLGASGPDGDIEVLALAASALRAAGLHEFLLDFGHADIARTLVEALSPELSALVLDALAHKDSARIASLLASSSHPLEIRRALEALPHLHGAGGEVWSEAERVLAKTPALKPLLTLRHLWDRAVDAGLLPVLRLDVGEVRGFAYYTGAIFHILAEGPGEPIGSGGRYDDLLERFGAPMPSAGFAIDLDHLAWALRTRGCLPTCTARVLVSGEGAQNVCVALRARGVSCACVAQVDALPYARAWSYSHLLTLGPDGPRLLELASSDRAPAPRSGLDMAGERVNARVPGEHPSTEVLSDQVAQRMLGKVPSAEGGSEALAPAGVGAVGRN